MSGKVLTLIVPAYNMERYLSKCLDSVIVSPELFQRVEVIVVNDGSTDRTLEIAREYATRYSGVFRVLNKQNGHYGSCINAGIKIASGSYLKVLDADDWFASSAFEQYLKFLISEVDKKDDAIDVVLTDWARVNEAGEVKGWGRLDFPRKCLIEMAQVVDQGLSIPVLTAITYKTALLRRCKYNQTERMPYTDNELVFYPMSVAKSFYYLPLELYQYFIGREGQSIELRTMERGSGSLLKIARRMVKEHNVGVCGADNKRYMYKWLLGFLAYIYKCYFSSFDVRKIRDELHSFDAEIKELEPQMYERLPALCQLNLGAGCCFDFVGYMRRGGGSRCSVWLVRKYDCLHKRISRLIKFR